MLSATGCGLLLKLVKEPPLVGYVIVGRDRRLLGRLVDLENGFQLSTCAIKNLCCQRTANAVNYAHLNVNEVHNLLKMAAHFS